MLSQEPDKGVLSGMTPCWKSQRTMDVLKCPAKLSQTRINRQGGNGSRGA